MKMEEVNFNGKNKKKEQLFALGSPFDRFQREIHRFSLNQSYTFRIQTFVLLLDGNEAIVTFGFQLYWHIGHSTFM